MTFNAKWRIWHQKYNISQFGGSWCLKKRWDLSNNKFFTFLWFWFWKCFHLYSTKAAFLQISSIMMQIIHCYRHLNMSQIMHFAEILLNLNFCHGKNWHINRHHPCHMVQKLKGGRLWNKPFIINASIIPTYVQYHMFSPILPFPPTSTPLANSCILHINFIVTY